MDGSTSRLPSAIAPPSPPVVGSTRHRSSTKDLPLCLAGPATAPAAAKFSIDPPRPAKEGYEWVWFPEGYWAERERANAPDARNSPGGRPPFRWRKRSAKGSTSREDNPRTSRDTDPRTSYETNPKSDVSWPFNNVRTPFGRIAMEEGSKAPLPSPYLPEDALVMSLQRPSLCRTGASDESGKSWRMGRFQALAGAPQGNQGSPGSPFSMLNTPDQETPQNGPSQDGNPTPRASLRTAQKTTLKSPGKSPDVKPARSWMNLWHRSKADSENGLNTPQEDYTDTTIEGAKEHLKQSTSFNPMSRISSLLREESRSPQLNKPKQRKLFGKSPWHRKTSGGSENSVSSSIRDILRGRTPLATPTSEKILDLDNSKTWSDNYPGGEAKRVHTPPLGGSTAGRPRSFFFDITKHPNNVAPPKSLPSKRAPHRSNNAHRQASNEPSQFETKEWWEVPCAIPRWEDMGPKSFEFDLPEHLPNSPMCPANKKHKSGGTGVCVYHGRRKRSSVAEEGEKSETEGLLSDRTASE